VLTFSRITPRQVVVRITKGECVAFVDVRGDDALSSTGLKVGGAVRVRPESIVQDAARVPRGCVVVVYGHDEGDLDVARVAEGLRAHGFREVRVLSGGFSAWVGLHYAVQPSAAAA
jgi:rhodanese-related sulfurtransferase